MNDVAVLDIAQPRGDGQDDDGDGDEAIELFIFRFGTELKFHCFNFAR